MAIESWSKCRVYGTWTDAEGNRLPGSVATTISARVTNTADDIIIPAGRYQPGCSKLDTSASAPSLDFQCPATDDPDIPETGWGVTIVVVFDGAGIKPETYVLDTIPSGGVIDLRTVIPTMVAKPLGEASLKIGQPGGVAMLNADGAVVDATGTPVSVGTGTSGAMTPLTDADLAI